MKLTTSLALGATLFLEFLIQTIWIGSIENVLVDQMITIGIISFFLFWYLKKEQSNYVRLGTKIGFYSGIICASLMFVYIYTIYPEYFDEFAAYQASKLEALGYDQYTINKMLTVVAAERNYFYLEISAIITTTFKAFAISLILSAFFYARKTSFQSNNI